MVMISFVIDIIYFIMVSVLSTWLYYDRLSGKRGSVIRRRMLGVAILIFASHLLIEAPVSENIKPIVYIGQIVIEFYIIVLCFDETLVNKLITYIELNIAVGVGMIAGSAITAGFDGSIKRIVYYTVTLALAGVVCLVLSYVDRRKDKTNNLQGIELSVVMCIAMLCMLYAAGMSMVEFREHWRVWIVYLFFSVISVMVIILLMMNKHLQQSEDDTLRRRVLKGINDNMDSLMEELIREEVYYSKKCQWLEDNFMAMYPSKETKDALEILVKEKIEKARAMNIALEYKLEYKGKSKIDTYDIIGMMANLLDNAIRATVHNEDNKRIINMDLYVSLEGFRLTVENPYTSNIFKYNNEYKTTKDDEKGHGLGLKSVREMAFANKLDMTVSSDGGIFKVVIDSGEKMV